uniref:NAD(P)/FAD-dependent oxidoreductase n=1 Tax=Achromobacter animicus TaxID=1389935 RepID=UPI0028AC86A6
MSIVMPVIVGAGSAGIRAAQTLAAQGLRPVILDEGLRPGGQIYRQPPPGFSRPKSALYGFEHRKADAVHRTMQQLQGSVEYRPGCLVWNAEGKTLDVLCDGVSTTVPYTHLILATGATDRVLPFPGWLTPGVYTLGGSQVALKHQGCAIGSRVAFLGTGPLLYLVAYQYAKAGAQVAAVLDTSRFADRVAALPGMLRAPALLAKGLYYMAWLRAHGVPLRSGVRPVAVQGGDRVTGLSYTRNGRTHTLDCDAVGFGLSLRSETQLASLIGCDFEFNERDRNWIPRRDAAGRSSLAGVYVAGDGAGIAGADAAELAGERAALALL